MYRSTTTGGFVYREVGIQILRGGIRLSAEDFQLFFEMACGSHQVSSVFDSVAQLLGFTISTLLLSILFKSLGPTVSVSFRGRGDAPLNVRHDHAHCLNYQSS